jgi:hypothetical protein
MTDVTPDPDESYDPTQQVQDYGDYNPESIDYDAQENDSAPYAQDATDNAANEQAYDPGYVETASQSVDPAHQSPNTSPTLSRPPQNEHGPQDATIPTHDQTSVTRSETFQPKTVNDTANPPQPEPSQDSSVLPKSVDLQALLAGLVPARSKAAPHSPPETRISQATTSYKPTLPAPAMNLPADIMYQLQSVTSPPPQTQPQFQSAPQYPPQTGPVDIQPQDLVLTPPEERLYEKFLENEREVVQHARWDQFPMGSRMFIGNLPTDRVGKKDIFRLFYPYGRLAQISMKQAYGFVQFYDKEDCDNAIRTQQGMYLTGRKVRMSFL